MQVSLDVQPDLLLEYNTNKELRDLIKSSKIQ